MTTLELYKFIENYNVEFHWNEEDVMMFVNNDNIKYFNSILNSSIFDDGGIHCVMKDGYIAFEMENICDYYDIELKDVFGENKEQ